MTLPDTIAILRTGSASDHPTMLTPAQCEEVVEALDLGFDLAEAALIASGDYRNPYMRQFYDDKTMDAVLSEVRSIAKRRFESAQVIPVKKDGPCYVIDSVEDAINEAIRQYDEEHETDDER